MPGYFLWAPIYGSINGEGLRRNRVNMYRFLLKFYEKAAAFRRSEAGATAIEYALIACGISTALIGVFFSTGTSLGDLWTHVFGKLTPYVTVS